MQIVLLQASKMEAPAAEVAVWASGRRFILALGEDEADLAGQLCCLARQTGLSTSPLYLFDQEGTLPLTKYYLFFLIHRPFF